MGPPLDSTLASVGRRRLSREANALGSLPASSISHPLTPWGCASSAARSNASFSLFVLWLLCPGARPEPSGFFCPGLNGKSTPYAVPHCYCTLGPLSGFSALAPSLLCPCCTSLLRAEYNESKAKLDTVSMTWAIFLDCKTTKALKTVDRLPEYVTVRSNPHKEKTP